MEILFYTVCTELETWEYFQEEQDNPGICFETLSLARELGDMVFKRIINSLCFNKRNRGRDGLCGI